MKKISNPRAPKVRYVNLSNSKLYNTRTDFIRDFFADKKLKVLDAGNLGDGPVNVPVRAIVESEEGEYFGIDVNKNLAESLNNKNQFIGDLHDLKGIIEDNEFDCVYLGQVIEHTWRPSLMINQCYRIIKPGGYLVIDTPNPFDLINLFRVFFLKRDTVGAAEDLTYNEAKDNFKKMREGDGALLSQPPHKIFYSPAMLQQLLNMHGFEIEEFVFIQKPRNFIHKLLVTFFPGGAQKLGIVARKSTLEKVFSS